MLTIAINCNNYLCILELASMLEARLESYPFAGIDFVPNDEGSGNFGDFGSAVSLTIVHDDHDGCMATSLDYSAADETSLIKDRDDHDYLIETGRMSHIRRINANLHIGHLLQSQALVEN